MHVKKARKGIAPLLVLITVVAATIPLAGTAAAAGETTVSLQPTAQTIAEGETATYKITVDSASNGVALYSINVSTNNPSAATIVGASNKIGGTTTKQFGPDNSSVALRAVGGQTANNTGTVVIATVTVRGENPGSAALTVTTYGVGDEDANEYTVTSTSPASVAVKATASFQVDDGTLSAPGSVTTGKNFSVSANISNVGGAAGSQSVDFRLNGTVIATQSVSLDPGKSTTVTFDNLSISTPGTYTHGVFVANDNETAEIAALAPDVNKNGNRVSDLNNDGLYEDIDGDGEFDIFDVQIFLNNFNTNVVQQNSGLFDFTGNQKVDIFDVQELLERV